MISELTIVAKLTCMIKSQNNNIPSEKNKKVGRIPMPTEGHLSFRGTLFKQGLCISIQSTIGHHQRWCQSPRTCVMDPQQ